jgi:hypothetical protein
MENMQGVFKHIRTIQGKYFSVQGEYGKFRVVWGIQNCLRIRGKYFSAYGEYAKRLLLYSPNTPRYIKSTLSRRIFNQNQKYFWSLRIYLDRIEWANKPSHTIVPLMLLQRVIWIQKYNKPYLQPLLNSTLEHYRWLKRFNLWIQMGHASTFLFHTFS